MRSLKVLQDEYESSIKRMREIRNKFKDGKKFYEAWNWWQYNPESVPLMQEYIDLRKHLPNLKNNINQAKMREMNKR